MSRTPKKARRWSGEVTRRSDAMDLEKNIFKCGNPRRIAISLKHSAETSRRRKGTPLQSAMSMLIFYTNRAGKNLSAKEKSVLARAKSELRKEFGKNEPGFRPSGFAR
ncbi:MAG: DUF3175 domain-containing protein [Limisphaerales bacterium]